MKRREEMKNRTILWWGIALVVVGLVAFSVNIAQAKVFQGRPGPGRMGPGGDFGPGGPGMPFAHLDLSDAQKEQFKALHEKARTDAQAYEGQLKPIHESLRAAVEAKTFDETAVRALIAKETQIMTELQVIRTRTEN